jgi:predicted peptidase
VKRIARTLRRGVLLASAVLLALLGCKKAEPPQVEAPSKQAFELAQRMLGKVYKQQRYAYPLPYRLFVPAGYDSSKRYPLVLYLHGAGGWGTDNVRHLNDDVAQLISSQVQALEASFVLAPQCPSTDQWVNGAHSVPFLNYVQANVPESDAARQTLQVLQEVERDYSVDKARVYITGPSMGGAGTWDYITRYAGLFAAAVPINGVNDPSRAATIATLPIWAFHGANDPVSPVSNTRTMVAALRKLGSTVRYSELPQAGHDCNAAAYHDLDVMRWLLAQRRAGAAERTATH